jgi:hypothetical protein
LARCRQHTTGPSPAFAGVGEKAANNCRVFPTTLASSFDQKLKDKIQNLVFMQKSLLARNPLKRQGI